MRGVENLPLVLSGLNLPTSARLVASFINASLPVLGFHSLITIPEGMRGAILGVMIDITMYGEKRNLHDETRLFSGRASIHS